MEGTAASVVCISSAESSRARSRWDKMGVAPDEGGRELEDAILTCCDNYERGDVRFSQLRLSGRERRRTFAGQDACPVGASTYIPFVR